MAKFAAIQMCSSRDVDENLRNAAALIARAAKEGAKLAVLPEMFAIMTEKTADKLIAKETLGAGKIQAFLSEQAKKHDIWLVGGTIPITGHATNKVKAASLVFNNQGERVAHYDKIHLFDVTLSDQEIYRESDSIEAGDHLTLVDSPFGKLGLAVCYDIRFPELFRWLFNEGADIFIVPAAFTVLTGTAHWELLARSRAVENFCYFIGACQGGRHANGRETYGHSLIIEPWGKVIQEIAGTTPSVICAEIDLAKVQQARKAVPVAFAQKIHCDFKKS
jgi:deaminated glutathione amidase